MTEDVLQVSTDSSPRPLEEHEAARLFEELYDELRRLASGYMRAQPALHTLQTTALVGEAYMKLARVKSGAWPSRGHFMAVAAQAMRSVLVDHARAKGAEKRRPIGFKVQLDGLVTSIEQRSASILDLDEALTELEALGRSGVRAVRVVELRFLCGLTMPEIAEALTTPLRSIERDWLFARTWLARRLK